MIFDELQNMLIYSILFVLFHRSTALTKQALPQKILNYVYSNPIQVCNSLKASICKVSTKYRPEQLLFDWEAIEVWNDAHCHSTALTLLAMNYR